MSLFVPIIPHHVAITSQAAIAQKRELFKKLAAENPEMAWAFGAK